MHPQPNKCIIADSDMGFRKTLLLEISRSSSVVVSNCFSNGFDIVIADINKRNTILIVHLFLDGISGVEIIQLIKKKLDNIKIIAYSMVPQVDLFQILRRHEVDVYCAKDPIEIKKALDLIISDNYIFQKTIFDPWEISLNNSNKNNESHDNISPINHKIIQEVCNGLSNKEIGNLLNLSTRTIEFHINKILLEFNLKSRTEIIIMAYKCGFCTTSCSFSKNKVCIRSYSFGS